jgi:hypothetical protein
MKKLFSIWLFIACFSFVYADNAVQLSQDTTQTDSISNDVWQKLQKKTQCFT